MTGADIDGIHVATINIAAPLGSVMGMIEWDDNLTRGTPMTEAYGDLFGD